MALSRKPKVASLDLSADARGVLDLLPRLLDRVEALYAAEGVPLPDRRYWMLGPEPSEDCEQVVVNLLQTYLGVPGDQAASAQQCSAPTTAVVNITVTREFPVGENSRAINTERITDASSWGAIDMGILSSGLKELSAMSDGYAGPGIIATISAGAPQGGLQTVVLNLSLVVG